SPCATKWLGLILWMRPRWTGLSVLLSRRCASRSRPCTWPIRPLAGLGEPAADRRPVLVEQRRAADALRPTSIELYGGPDRVPGAVRRVHRHDQSEVPHLRIAHHLVDAVDRRERHIVCAEPLDPVGERLPREQRVELRAEALVML